MNPLSIKIEAGKSYTQVGNFFSRFLLLQENLKNYNSILLITEDEYSQKSYEKLSTYFEIPFFKIIHEYELTYLEEGLF